MCMAGLGNSQTPSPPPPAPPAIPIEDLTAKTATSIKKAAPKKKKTSFRRTKSGGSRPNSAVKALNLTPKKTS